jgi:protein SCO1
VLKILNKFLIFVLICFSFNLFALPDESIYNLNINIVSKDGQNINIKELSGKVQIFSMIYTRCKTICPVIIANMKNIEKTLPKEILDDVSFTLITLDHERDSFEDLQKFFIKKKMNNKLWNIYKTSQINTLKIAISTGIKYKKDIENNEYIHSNLIIVLDKEGVIKFHHQGLDKNYEKLINVIKQLI